MAQPVRFKAIVKAINHHDKDVASYQLYSEKRLPHFSPGQFIHLAIDEFDPSSFWPESRVFSVANAVLDRHTLDLTIGRQGDYTARILDELKIGDSVWAKGPYGEFCVDKIGDCDRIVMIAGGTGVTPFCSFMDSAINLKLIPADEVILYYGARTSNLLIYHQLAERCSRAVPGFSAKYYVEHPQTSDDMVGINHGRLSIDAINSDLGGCMETVFYISGPKSMIQGFSQDLVESYQVDSSQVILDAWE